MSDELAALVEERSRRVVKKILSTKENVADPYLGPSERQALRAIILDEIADLTRLSCTLLRSLDGQLKDGYALNQLWLEQIGAVVGADPPVSNGAAPG